MKYVEMENADVLMVVLPIANTKDLTEILEMIVTHLLRDLMEIMEIVDVKLSILDLVSSTIHALETSNAFQMHQEIIPCALVQLTNLEDTIVTVLDVEEMMTVVDLVTPRDIAAIILITIFHHFALVHQASLEMIALCQIIVLMIDVDTTKDVIILDFVIVDQDGMEMTVPTSLNVEPPLSISNSTQELLHQVQIKLNSI